MLVALVAVQVTLQCGFGMMKVLLITNTSRDGTFGGDDDFSYSEL